MQAPDFDPAPPVASAFAALRGDIPRPELGPIVFRRFCLYPHTRQMTRDGAPVDIGSRAFDLLVVLLRARGRVVSKAEIFRAVWPSTTVDESNLRFQMTVLRKLMGPDRDMIKTVAGRGYFLAEEIDDDGRAASGAGEVARRGRDAAPDSGFQPERVRAQLTALETENSLLRRALSELALDKLFPDLRALA